VIYKKERAEKVIDESKSINEWRCRSHES